MAVTCTPDAGTERPSWTRKPAPSSVSWTGGVGSAARASLGTRIRSAMAGDTNPVRAHAECNDMASTPEETGRRNWRGPGFGEAFAAPAPDLTRALEAAGIRVDAEQDR